jgi:phage shock protein C
VTGTRGLAADRGPAAPVVREMVDMSDGNGNKVLRRSRSGRMVAGVCAGAAEYFGIDVTLVRVIVAVVAVITGGAGVLAYLAAWVIIPGEGEKTSIAEDIVTKKQDASASR